MYCQTLLCLPRIHTLNTVTSHVLYLAGGQEQLSSLQQHLDTLSQGQAKLGLDVAALKANASPASASSLDAKSGPQPEQQAANDGSAQTADSKSTGDIGSAADSSTAGIHGNVLVQPNLAMAGGDVVQRLDTLAAEVGESLLAACRCKVTLSAHVRYCGPSSLIHMHLLCESADISLSTSLCVNPCSASFLLYCVAYANS